MSERNFINEYAQWDRSLIKNEVHAALVFDSFCRFMQHWMINEGQPVDLGFAKLHALMARVNFHMAAYVRMDRLMNQKGRKQPTAKEKNGIICKHLTDPEMGAWDEALNCFRWNLFAVPSKSFRLTYLELEAKKRCSGENLNDFDYFQRARDQLRRQLPTAYEVYRHFITEAGRPIVVIPDGDTSRRKWDAYGALRKKVRPPPAVCRSHIVVGKSIENGTAQIMAGENAGVPQMSDLQPQNEDVRDGAEKVDKPRGGGG